MTLVLADHPRTRLAFLCLLYLAQGVPFGFVTVALAAHLVTQGADAASIGGVIAMAMLPWSFKWAWGPVVGFAWLAFAFIAPFWNRSDVVVASVAADTICQAITTVALFAVFMRVASPHVAATQFTASMALMNLATSLGSALAGPIGAIIEAPTAFLIAGYVQTFAGPLLPKLVAPQPADTSDAGRGG